MTTEQVLAHAKKYREKGIQAYSLNNYFNATRYLTRSLKFYDLIEDIKNRKEIEELIDSCDIDEKILSKSYELANHEIEDILNYFNFEEKDKELEKIILYSPVFELTNELKIRLLEED